MDEAVLKAIARWPNVPAVFGWLRLDARGHWWVRNAATNEFESISNPAIVAFIGRNYARDAHGRYFFQNGPQRVFVTLAATPYVYRIADQQDGLLAHNDRPAGRLRALLLDEAGALCVDAELGPGLLEDRDLPLLIARLRGADGGELPDPVLENVMRGRATIDVTVFGANVALARLPAAERARRFAFVADPQP